MSKVYLVTAGSYSNYSIRGAFSTEEKAKVYADYLDELAGNVGSADVETYELDSEEPKPVIKYWVCQIKTDTGELLYSEAKNRTTEYNIRSSATHFNSTGVSSKSAEHAHKLAVEMRQQWRREFQASGHGVASKVIVYGNLLYEPKP